MVQRTEDCKEFDKCSVPLLVARLMREKEEKNVRSTAGLCVDSGPSVGWGTAGDVGLVEMDLSFRSHTHQFGSAQFPSLFYEVPYSWFWVWMAYFLLSTSQPLCLCYYITALFLKK